MVKAITEERVSERIVEQIARSVLVERINDRIADQIVDIPVLSVIHRNACNKEPSSKTSQCLRFS